MNAVLFLNFYFFTVFFTKLLFVMYFVVVVVVVVVFPNIGFVTQICCYFMTD
jgi:hypothetical protein